MNTNEMTHDLVSWLREQVNYVNQAKDELEKTHNYGKATLCEGMREAYMKCLQKLEAA